MNMMTIDAERVAELVTELNKNHRSVPPRFEPYLIENSADERPFYGPDQRTLLSAKLLLHADKAIASGKTDLLRYINERLSAKTAKLFCDAALADIEFADGRIISAANDGVETTYATNGLTLETFGTIQSFFDDPMSVGVAVSKAEHEKLRLLYELHLGSGQIVVEGPNVTHVAGMQILQFRTFENEPILKEERGERWCFAVGKGALYFQLVWQADLEKNLITAKLGAVRTKDGPVRRLLTIE